MSPHVEGWWDLRHGTGGTPIHRSPEGEGHERGHLREEGRAAVSVPSDPAGPGRGLACPSAPEEPTQTSPGLSSCPSEYAELLAGLHWIPTRGYWGP